MLILMKEPKTVQMEHDESAERLLKVLLAHEALKGRLSDIKRSNHRLTYLLLKHLPGQSKPGACRMMDEGSRGKSVSFIPLLLLLFFKVAKAFIILH